MSERFVGVDLHKKLCYFAELDSRGNLLRRGKFGNNIGEVSAFAVSLHPRTMLTVEPLLNYLWFLDQVEPYVESVHPVNPYKARVIAEAKCKTDRYDALMLAELLRTNFLPESYYVPKHIRDLRDMVRQRIHLVGHRVMLKNRMRHLVFLHGQQVLARDISSSKAQREVKGLFLPPSIRHSFEQCQKLILGLDELIGELETEIEARCSGIEDVAILQTVNGIGLIWSAAIYSEVVEINRFRSKKAFISYTGLAPIVRASGDRVVTGGITHQGSSLLRTALVEAGMVARRHSPDLNRLYWRVLHRSNEKTARIAVARKLAIIIYVLLKEKRSFWA
jgi:transposase